MDKEAEKGKAQLEEKEFCLSKVLKELWMDAYLKDQFDFTGVKAALLVEQKYFWSFSEIISRYSLAKYMGVARWWKRRSRNTT